MNIELTKEEQNAIHSLERLAKRWPKTLWLFSASGTLEVYKLRGEGEQVHVSNGSVDPNYCVTTIHGIPNDGGDY